MATAATLDEHLEPLRADPSHSAVLLDVDGVLAPIVRHADDAHVPEPTRVPLIAVAKRYGLVACVSRAPRHDRAADRLAGLDHLRRQPRRRGPARRRDRGRARPRGRGLVAAHATIGRARRWNDELHRLRVRAEDKDVIRAYHWRGAPDEARRRGGGARARRARRGRPGWSSHWGRKVLEVRPPVALNKGRGVEHLLEGTDITPPLYVGDDNTDLDAFEALRAAGGRRAPADRASASACAPTRRPPELEAQADVLVDGPVGVRALLSALAA